jgi:DNA-binding transcriptional ArsR family regulator
MDAFAALADPTRRQIIELLAEQGQMTATSIAGQFAISAPAISQHLKLLRKTGLVDMEKRKQQRLYRLNPAVLAQVEAWAQRTALRWHARYRALDDVLAAEQAKLSQKGSVTHE